MDGTPLAAVPLHVLVLGAAYLAFVGVVKGTSGFGSGLLAVPVVVQVVPPEFGIAAFTLTIWVGNLPILLADGIQWPFLREQRGLVVAALLGTLVGLAGLTVVPVPVIYLSIAAFVVVVLALDRRPDLIVGLARRRGAGPAAGWIGGVVTGAFLSGGPVFVSYLHANRTEKTAFATTMALLIFLMTTVRIASLAGAGGFGRAEALVGASFLVPLAVGVVAGTRLRSYIPQRRFERLVTLMLVAIAAKLTVDGVTGLA